MEMELRMVNQLDNPDHADPQIRAVKQPFFS
jgi:hypothetical protein